MARKIAVTVGDDFPQEVVALLEATPLKVDAMDLLPILAEGVGLKGENLHGFCEHEDLDEIAAAERLLGEALNHIRAVDILRRWDIGETGSRREACDVRASFRIAAADWAREVPRSALRSTD